MNEILINLKNENLFLKPNMPSNNTNSMNILKELNFKPISIKFKCQILWKFKKNWYTFLHNIKKFVKNNTIEQSIKVMFKTFIIEIKSKFEFYYSKGIDLSIKIFKILIFYTLKNKNIFQINKDSIICSLKENDLFIIIQSYRILNNLLTIFSN